MEKDINFKSTEENVCKKLRPEKSNCAEVQLVTWTSLIVNVLLSVLKFILGIVGSSQAVLADAVHSLSDMSTDIAILFGVRYWSAPADEEHPYGHQKIETIVTIIIGIILAVVALGIGYNALVALHRKHVSQPTIIAFIGALGSIICKEALYRWSSEKGKKIRSSALIANAWHHRSDALSSVLVAFALVIAVFIPSWSFVDHVGAVVVCLFIFHASWKIITTSFSELIDEGAGKNERKAIRDISLSQHGVRLVHAIRTRRVSNGIYVDLHVLVNGDMTVSTGHEISEKVKQALLKDGPDVIDVVVHLEPIE
ncbi:MAG: cation transporter [Candidatus Aureabacteria bacterium]|nr:cation transporter [Candidatus Auribacterota bacterium]